MKRLLFLLLLVSTLASAQGLRERSAEYFLTPDADRVARQVMAYQRTTGGWPKNIDMAREMTEAELALAMADSLRTDDSTTDNDATTTQMAFLARLFRQKGYEECRVAVERGVRYLLAGQYDNGGWPQFWPQMRGYQRHITINDNAMVHTLRTLRDIGEGRDPYDSAVVSDTLRLRCLEAFGRGIDCLLRCQIVYRGEPTVWCQQHDRETLLPAPARAFELASFCSAESAEVVRLLMELPSPDERVQRAVRGAMKWFAEHKITGKRLVRDPLPRLADDPQAEPLWARFYDLERCEPFVCDRDGLPRLSLEDLGEERRTGYSWYNTSAQRLFPLYEEWEKGNGKIGE